MSSENCHRSRKPGEEKIIEEIVFTGFRKKKFEEEHGKLSSGRAIKRTGFNCSLLL